MKLKVLKIYAEIPLNIFTANVGTRGSRVFKIYTEIPLKIAFDVGQ